MKRGRVGGLDNLANDLAGRAILHPYDGGLAHSVSPCVELLHRVLVLLKPADVCLVGFHGAGERLAIVLPSLADVTCPPKRYHRLC